MVHWCFKVLKNEYQGYKDYLVLGFIYIFNIYSID